MAFLWRFMGDNGVLSPMMERLVAVAFPPRAAERRALQAFQRWLHSPSQAAPGPAKDFPHILHNFSLNALLLGPWALVRVQGMQAARVGMA
jgi:hypothetical protein